MAADDIIRKIEDLLNSSTKLSSATKQNFKDQLDLLIRQNAELSRFQALIDSIGDSVDAVRDNLSYIQESLKDSVNELSRQNIYLNSQKSALNKLSDIAKQTLSIRRGETELDTRKLAKLKLETTERIRQLEFAKRNPDITREGIEALEDQIKTANLLYSSFAEITKINDEFNKKLGFGPKLAAGLDKALSKIGMPSLGISEALSETRMLYQESVSTGQKISLWGTFSGKLKDNISSSVTRANLLQAAIMLFVDALKDSDKATGQLAKDFNVTYDQAIGIREQLIEIGNSSGDIAVNARALQESMVAVGKSLGSNAMLNEKDLVTFTRLRERAGFANEELVAMEKLTLATGGNLEDNVKNLLFSAKITGLNNKVLLNEKDIMRDIAKASDAVKLSLAGNPKALGEAAAQAKALGMSLEQVDNIAESLLDFESSIANELSAELITGRELNLEQARLYALNNDMAGLSREIAKNFGTAADFSKMNRLQQEATAKAVGMNREELARVLTDQEALKGLSGKQAEAAKIALAAARARGMSEEEIAKQGIDNLMKQQSIQDRFNQSVEKLKEIFISIAEPVLEIISPFSDLLTDILPAAMTLLRPLIGMLNAIAHIVAGIIKAVTFDFTGAAESFKKVPTDIMKGIEAPFKMVGKGLGFSSKTQEVQDGEFRGTGALISKFNAGEITPVATTRPDDNIYVSTNKPSVAPTNTSMDISPLIDEIKALRQEVAKNSSKPTIIENSIDGTKFGTATAIATYMTQ